MDLGWVGMTSVWSEKVRPSRWNSMFKVDIKYDYRGDYRGGIREYFRESKVIRWTQEELV